MHVNVKEKINENNNNNENKQENMQIYFESVLSNNLYSNQLDLMIQQ